MNNKIENKFLELLNKKSVCASGKYENGYGTGLMNYIKEYIKEISCRKMFLITNKSNVSACKCYEKAGGVNNADDEIVYVYK